MSFFEHYAKISGKPIEEIEDKFGHREGFEAIYKREYYSGGHGIFHQNQKMHLGLVPKANQKLKTLEI